MRYQMLVAAALTMALAGCDDPKPTAANNDNGRPVSAPSATAGSSAGQGVVAKENPGDSMMMQSGGNGGNASTMSQGSAMTNQPRPGPDGEPLAGTQPLKPAPSNTAPGDTAPNR